MKQFRNIIRKCSSAGVVILTCLVLANIGIVVETSAAQTKSNKEGRASGARMSPQESQAKTDRDIELISNALEEYKKDKGIYPSDEQGLKGLLSLRSSGSEQGKPYLNDLPKTPYGRDYVFKKTGVRLIYRAQGTEIPSRGYMRGMPAIRPAAPSGSGWEWNEQNKQWEKQDNGYIIQVWQPKGTFNSMPKKQFGSLPAGIYIAPSSAAPEDDYPQPIDVDKLLRAK